MTWIINTEGDIKVRDIFIICTPLKILLATIFMNDQIPELYFHGLIYVSLSFYHPLND